MLLKAYGNPLEPGETTATEQVAVEMRRSETTKVALSYIPIVEVAAAALLPRKKAFLLNIIASTTTCRYPNRQAGHELEITSLLALKEEEVSFASLYR